jgi:hypothetical protein
MLRLICLIFIFQISQQPDRGKPQEPTKKEYGSSGTLPASVTLTNAPLTNAPITTTASSRVQNHASREIQEKSSCGDVPTWLLVVVGAVAAYLALCTLDDLKKQTKNTETAADAALLNAQSIINAERAWIDGGIVEAINESKELIEKIYGENDAIEYSLKIVNHGKALVASWRIKFISGRDTLVQQVSDTLHLLMGSGKSEYLRTFDLRDIFADHWNDILSAKMSVAIDVTIRYFDLISTNNETSHETSFVYRYSAHNGDINRLSGDNKYT